MLGTLNGVLEARGMKFAPGALRAEVEGHNEIRDRLPVLTRVHVHYSIPAGEAEREVIDRALERHQGKCPTAQTLAGSVEITWSAEFAD